MPVHSLSAGGFRRFLCTFFYRLRERVRGISEHVSGARGDLIEARVRSWFLRNALDSLERVQGAEARERISAGIPKRLSPLIARERLRLASAIDAVNLQDAEDVLFSIDASLGHGAGTSMEDVAMHVVTRAVSEGSASLSESDLAGSVLRLRSMLESPFVDVPVLFELTRTPEGFTLAVGVAGRPRATRLLRHYATGAIRAAWRLMRDAPATEPRISAESIADRAFISVVLRDGTSENAPASRARSKPVGRPSGPVTGLVAEVERILGSRLENGTSDLPRRDSSYPPKRASDRPSRPD